MVKENVEPACVVWWLCYLSADDPIFYHISEIGKKLKEQGQCLVVFGHEGDYSQHTGFVHFAIPFSLAEHGRKWSNFLSGAVMPMTATSIPELIDAESQWCGSASSYETEWLILRALTFWEKAAQIMRPALILTWGTTVPFSRALMRIAQMTQTPAYVMERGLTEATLMLNIVGQCFLSNIGTRPQFISPKREISTVESEWAEIVSYYRNTSIRNYQFANSGSSPISCCSDDGASVLYLGAFDLGSGITFDNKIVGDRLGGWLKSSNAGLQEVVETLNRVAPNSTLHVKAHPHSPIDIRALGNEGGVRIVEHKDRDFRELLEKSDILITPISTTQIYGLFYDKPVVTLANGFFSGRNIVYEAYSKQELDDAISGALLREGWRHKHQKAMQLITTLFRDEFIGLNDDVPTSLKLPDFIEHLGHFRNYNVPNMPSAQMRIQQFEDFSLFSSGAKQYLDIQSLPAIIGNDNWGALLDDIKALVDAEVRGRYETEIANSNERTAQNERIIAELQQSIAHFQTQTQQAEERNDLLANQLQELRTLYADIDEKLAQATKSAGDAHENLSRVTQNIHGLSRLVEMSQADNVRSNSAESSQIGMALEGDARDIDLDLGTVRAALMSLHHLTSDIQSLRVWADKNGTWREDRGRLALARSILSRGPSVEEAPNQIDYLLANPDLILAGVDPIYHWNKFGWKEGRPKSAEKPTKD